MQETPQLARHCLLSLLLVAVIALSGCIKTGEDYTQLSIDTVDISTDHIKSSSIDFNITTYVENHGNIGTKNASLLLKAYNDQNDLLVEQIKTPVGSIDAKKTIAVTQALELPRKGDYRIEVNLYDGDIKKTYQWTSISNLDSLQADIKDIGLEIGEMDFLVRNASNRKVVIENDIYFTNEGDDNSSEFDVLVKAREMDARLIADKKWTRLKAIKPETTVIKSVNLTVPDQYNYVVEVLVWSKGMVVKRAEGTVLLRPLTKLEEGERIEGKSIDTSRFETAEEAVAPAEAPAKAAPGEGIRTPGFGIPIALAAAAAAAILRRRLYGR